MDVRKNIQQIFNIYLQNFILLVLASSITGLICFPRCSPPNRLAALWCLE